MQYLAFKLIFFMRFWRIWVLLLFFSSLLQH